MFWGRKLRSENHRGGCEDGQKNENSILWMKNFFVWFSSLIFYLFQFRRLLNGVHNAIVELIQFQPCTRRLRILREVPAAAREAVEDWIKRKKWNRKHDPIDNTE